MEHSKVQDYEIKQPFLSQDFSSDGSTPIHGYLMKRSDTLRIWNQRWFSLDLKTARLEYRTNQKEQTPRGVVRFDSDSTITVSPINFHGGKQYEGCCFYIGSSRSQSDYFLCAETAEIAKAWVSAIRAAAKVLRAHEEAINSLSSSNQGQSKAFGAVESARAMAIKAARDAAQHIHPKIRSLAEVGPDNMTIMRETLRVKDEELNAMAAKLRSSEATVKELSDKLTEAVSAAETASESAQKLGKVAQDTKSEVQRLTAESEQLKRRAELAESKLALLLSQQEKKKEPQDDSVAVLGVEDVSAEPAEASEMVEKEAGSEVVVPGDSVVDVASEAEFTPPEGVDIQIDRKE